MQPEQGVIMKVISLKVQLIKSTVVISLLCALIGFIVICATVIHSNDEVFDELLDSNAHALLGDNKQAYPDIEHSLQYLNDEMDIEYQVYDNQGRLLSKTMHAPDAPYTAQFEHDYYDNVWQDGELWRVYTAYDQGLNRYVQIAQPWKQRLEYAWPIVANYAGLMVVLLIALAIGNAWSIRKNLVPLNRLTQEIDQKNLQNLSLITPPVVIRETKPLIVAINELFTRLMRAKDAQERFTADASHELRTPLSAVSMKLQLLQRKFADQPMLVDEVGRVRQDVLRATDLVESLLTLARLENDTTIGTFESVSVQALFDDVMVLVDGDIRHQSAKIMCVHEPDSVTEMTVMMDRRLMLIALRNLIDNALKYGGEHLQIYLMAKKQGDNLVLTVADDGVGVAQPDLARLGERFFRVLGSKKTGSGLGLSIVQKIAEHHHGHVSITTGEYSKGLAVAIYLPLAS
ncbi:ATP-binding protein [uncultured Moraxella sp.]|uniref:sensor histidine kinase n=1 Tax=uncultured Moraxella sp. TaxID=263769 RepID=UPI0025EC48A3|nr:ATP-binding protein [uncultured Moraxella sp.]